ncbi:unnamed protein product, partial [Rotaria magnacalcarata]
MRKSGTKIEMGPNDAWTNKLTNN